ncbi:hypothetical protein AX761_20210 [Rhizobium sp. 58]|nr:hypothetical protein AX761_20210 [Rhizobium sp. 58]
MNAHGKRYLVFAGDGDFSQGGWSDFVFATDDPEAAIKRAEQEASKRPAWAEVIDLTVCLPVWRIGFAEA